MKLRKKNKKLALELASRKNKKTEGDIMNYFTAERTGVTPEQLTEIRAKTAAIKTAEKRSENLKKRSLLAELTALKNSIRRKGR